MLPEPISPDTRAHGVLVADDDPAVRTVVHTALGQHGFAVWQAADGREALEIFRRHCECIDVVLLDVCMPNLDGPQTLAALRELNTQVRCCFMTGGSDDYTEQGLHHLGAEAVFLKPFRLPEVARVLRDVAQRCA